MTGEMDLSRSLEGRLLLAVPKKGRLSEPALNLLAEADIQFRREKSLDIALVKNLPVAVIFLRAADIPKFVSLGRVELGITGLDLVAEHEAAVEAAVDEDAINQLGSYQIVMPLGFGACRLQVQVPEFGKYTCSQDLIGRTIGTSFVSLTARYFASLEADCDSPSDPITLPRKSSSATKRLRTTIVELSGSVEAACVLGAADGIVDLVESGRTMRAAGLKAIDTVVESSAVLIKSHTPVDPALVSLIVARISQALASQRQVISEYSLK